MRHLIAFAAALLLAASASAQTWTTQIEGGGIAKTSFSSRPLFFSSTGNATSPILAIGTGRANLYFDNDRTVTNGAATLDIFWCGNDADVIGSGCNPLGFVPAGGSSATNQLSGAVGVNAVFDIELPQFLLVRINNASGATSQVYLVPQE